MVDRLLSDVHNIFSNYSSSVFGCKSWSLPIYHWYLNFRILTQFWSISIFSLDWSWIIAFFDKSNYLSLNCCSSKIGKNQTLIIQSRFQYKLYIWQGKLSFLSSKIYPTVGNMFSVISMNYLFHNVFLFENKMINCDNLWVRMIFLFASRF